MAEAWKEVRVFISSTFKDMQAERDHLVRFVFPRLREELLKRRMHLVDVDLRWGVTGDQDAFDLCMDEIKRCHPRFICMLGGRYGWIPAPKTIDQNALGQVLSGTSPARQLSDEDLALLRDMYALNADEGNYRLRAKPQAIEEVKQWNKNCEEVVKVLQRAVMPEAQFSITASEIHFGALDRLAEPIFRYFYFRDPAVSASIPDEQKADEDEYKNDYREPAGSFAEKALAELKETIKTTTGKIIQTGVSISGDAKLIEPGQVVEAPLPFFEYPCRWDNEAKRVVDLREFGARVYKDLLDSVDAQFGLAAAEPPDPFAEENAAMEAFIETRVERYVVGSRQSVFDDLLQHAEGTGGNGYLCVVGEPGSGKSALLGKFYRDYVGTEEHPPHKDDLVIPHFVGASAPSTNARQVLRRFCHELAVSAGINEELPDDYDKLREAFPKFLEQAAAAKHVVILIDAINQMDPAHNAQAMRWLPDELPDNVRIIMSTIKSDDPVPALAALRARRQPPIEVELRALNESDATALVEQFLDRYRKTFDDRQRAALLGKTGSATPLYLLTALEELRTLGTYEEIIERIKELPAETRPLFVWILNRLENDEGFRDEHGHKIGPEFVRRYCSYLAIGRSGMAQSELVELIAPANPENEVDADAQGNVAALQRLLRAYLMQRGELLDFFHGQLREAVEEKYLADEEKKVTANKGLAEYFQQKADPAGDATWTGDYPRGLSELPYHQTEGQLWEGVYKTLTDLGFLEAKCTHVAVTTSGTGPDARKIYGGVYELQEDYRQAIEKMPA
ncbi:MAG: DUF4062 domain-containing protein [Acidobacteriota bacterium]|nr:DUF4062 domain-containing protein [Acidobacteriota bacterium]